MGTAAPTVIDVVEAMDEHGAAVIGLWRECELTRPWNDPEADLRSARESPGSTVLVALRGGSVIGTVMVGFDGHRGWLYYLAVSPTEQGAGIGRRLVVEAEAWLVARGAPKVQLMVRSGNTRVLGFYDRLGYEDQSCVVLGRRLD